MEGPGGGGNPFLHTCLARGDFMAFFAELPKTNNLFVRDRGGRTVMELAMQMAVELFQSCLSTSFAIDSSALGRSSGCACAVCAHKRHRSMRDGSGENQKSYNCKNPMRIRYNEQYLSMYEQPRQMRINAQRNPPVPSLPPPCKFTPAEYPPGWRPEATGLPGPKARGPVDHSQGAAAAAASFPLPSGALAAVPGPSQPQQYFYPCDAESEALQRGSNAALEQVKLENKMVQREVMVLVEEVLGAPLCDLMKARMKRLLQKLRSLLLVIKRLGCCSLLRIKATETAVQTQLLQQKVTYPFLYTALMHRVFKLFRAGPNGEAFDPLHPADGRRMVQLLVNYQLPGFEICLFLGNVLSLFSDFISFFAQDDVNIWRPCREVQQFYLHMAFALDSVFLFKFIINFGQLFAGPEDVFKWEDLLYVLMEHRDRFRPYFSALLASRLKSRVQKRLVEEGTAQEIKNKYPPEPVKYPCEERLLTAKVLEDYGALFGVEEAREFSQMLKRWKYGAVREETNKQINKKYQYPAASSSSRADASCPQAFWA
ncbi:hypothetical protein, conserved [Eimeria brunetti]|uniref:Uncharacterized protein n=1 Tax=Eimeria brunetti TaxID=51314 RepID=U6LI17_9EIME|nr:hypothetical protein, conserved [Eimeria brunetti]